MLICCLTGECKLADLLLDLGSVHLLSCCLMGECKLADLLLDWGV